MLPVVGAVRVFGAAVAPEVLETGGGLLKAKDLFKRGEKFITCNVDILTDLDAQHLRIGILDDGLGMTETELLAAMRPGR